MGIPEAASREGGVGRCPLLKRRDVTIIVCSNDIVAISIQRALRDLGIAVPGDVSLAGCDDIPWAAIATPALTTMRLPIDYMGRATVQFFLDGLKDPHRRSRCLSLAVTLVERASVAKPRSRRSVPKRRV